MILDDKSFHLACFNIIKSIWATRIFSSREPNLNKPTAIYLLVQSYLQQLYNGSFIANTPLIESDKKKYKNDYLDSIKGDWNRIEETILNSIPRDMNISFSMDKFFWNENTQRSMFLNRCVINQYNQKEVSKDDLDYLKSKELKDTPLCCEIMCPKYDKCARTIRVCEGMRSIKAYVYNSDGCSFYIEDVCKNEEIRLDL